MAISFSFVESLSAVEVESLLLEIGFTLFDIGFCGFFCSEKAADIGLRRGDGGFLRCDGGGGLNVFDSGKNGAGFDVVALFDIEVSDATEGGGADVDVGLWLDLSGAADE